MSLRRFTWLALLAALACEAHAAAPAPTERIIVGWRNAPERAADPALADRRLQALERDGRLALRRLRRLGSGMEVLQVERGGVEGALRELHADPEVAFVVPDGRVRAHAAPSDPLLEQQWYLGAGQVAATRATEAWNLTLGGSPSASPVVVAVIDTGVRFDHPDLGRAAEGGKLVPGYDFVSGDGAGLFTTANDGDGWDGDPSDPGDFLTAEDLQSDLYRGKGCGAGDDGERPSASSWHGTRVAGLIGAMSDNGEGITGTGYHVRVLPVRALGKCGGYDSDVLAAMYWAAGLSIPAPLLAGAPPANPWPARVINMSLGSTGACNAAYRQATRDLIEAGVLIVASAGNDGGPVDAPANCPGVLAVAGLRHAGSKVGYSNLGNEVALGAPAGNCVNVDEALPCLFSLITTSDSGQRQPAGPIYFGDPRTTGGNYGTSFSAPLVSAAAGLMLSVNPGLTPASLTNRLKATARPFPSVSDTVPAPPVCRVPASATDIQDAECLCTTAACGAGMLDIGEAVRDALRPVALATVHGTVGPGRTLTLDGSASTASQGRTLSHAWSVASVSGGATAPVLATPAAPTTTFVSPTFGTVVLRLTVTDDHGAIDTAEVSITAANGGGNVDTPSAPPTTPPAQASAGSGGGGALDGFLLALLGLLAARRARSLED